MLKDFISFKFPVAPTDFDFKNTFSPSKHISCLFIQFVQKHYVFELLNSQCLINFKMLHLISGWALIVKCQTKYFQPKELKFCILIFEINMHNSI